MALKSGRAACSASASQRPNNGNGLSSRPFSSRVRSAKALMQASGRGNTASGRCLHGSGLREDVEKGGGKRKMSRRRQPRRRPVTEIAIRRDNLFLPAIEAIARFFSL